MARLNSSENVISLNKFRASKSKLNYKKYLRLLESEELTSEIDNILELNDPISVELSFLERGEMVLAEISHRTSSPFQHSIDSMQSLLSKKINKLNYFED